MEQYVGKKLFKEIMTYIVGYMCAGLLLMGVVFTVIAKITTNENNDMMDIATIGYSFAIVFGIIFILCILCGNLDRFIYFKQSMKKLNDRGLTEMAQHEFESENKAEDDIVLTEHFLYLRGKGIIIPVEDLAWAYIQRINVKRTFGEGTPMHYQPWIYDIYGEQYTAVYVYDQYKYEKMSYVINSIKNVNENVMIGYSEEIEKIYKQKYQKI